MKTNSSPHRACRRSGLAIIVVLACLAIVMALVLSWVKTAALEQRQLRALEDQAQAVWLTESGIERAAWKLAENADYSGEIWQLTAEELSQSRGGEVTIRVERPATDQANATTARTIVVTADFPTGAERRARHSKQIQLTLNGTGANP